MPHQGCRFDTSGTSICLRPVAEGQQYCPLHYEMVHIGPYTIGHQKEGDIGVRPTMEEALKLLDVHLDTAHANDPEVHGHTILSANVEPAVSA